MKRKYLVLGLLLSLALIGCPMAPRTGINPAQPEGAAERGTVTLSVPAIPAYLAKALGVSPSAGASAGKAVLIINRVELELWLSGDEPVDTYTGTPSSGPNMNQPITWDVPAAVGYTIHARIYNTAVDAASPLLYGEAGPFDVAPGGTTNVTIRPIPLDPIAVPFAGTPVRTTLASCFDTGTTQPVTVDPGPDGIWGTADDITIQTPVYGWAEERWFSFNTSSYSAIRVNADAVDTASGIYMIFADGTGRSRAQALTGGFGNGGPAYWTYGGVATLGALTQETSECYLGLVTISSTVGSSVTSTVDVSFTPLTDDAFEENDTIGTAAVLPQSAVIDAIDLDSPDWYSYPPTGGDWYSITQTEANDDYVTIVCEFDMDQGDLEIELFGYNGSNYYWIAESDTSTLSGPSNPAAKEEERIANQYLDPGVYYLSVRSSGGPGACGVPYKLQWVAGYGAIIIGIE